MWDAGDGVVTMAAMDERKGVWRGDGMISWRAAPVLEARSPRVGAEMSHVTDTRTILTKPSFAIQHTHPQHDGTVMADADHQYANTPSDLARARPDIDPDEPSKTSPSRECAEEGRAGRIRSGRGGGGQKRRRREAEWIEDVRSEGAGLRALPTGGKLGKRASLDASAQRHCPLRPCDWRRMPCM